MSMKSLRQRSAAGRNRAVPVACAHRRTAAACRFRICRLPAAGAAIRSSPASARCRCRCRSSRCGSSDGWASGSWCRTGPMTCTVSPTFRSHIEVAGNAAHRPLPSVVLQHALDRQRQVVVAGPLAVARAGHAVLARVVHAGRRRRCRAAGSPRSTGLRSTGNGIAAEVEHEVVGVVIAPRSVGPHLCDADVAGDGGGDRTSRAVFAARTGWCTRARPTTVGSGRRTAGPGRWRPGPRGQRRRLVVGAAAAPCAAAPVAPSPGAASPGARHHPVPTPAAPASLQFGCTPVQAGSSSHAQLIGRAVSTGTRGTAAPVVDAAGGAGRRRRPCTGCRWPRRRRSCVSSCVIAFRPGRWLRRCCSGCRSRGRSNAGLINAAVAEASMGFRSLTDRWRLERAG